MLLTSTLNGERVAIAASDISSVEDQVGHTVIWMKTTHVIQVNESPEVVERMRREEMSQHCACCSKAKPA